MALSHSGLLGLDFERRGGLLGLEKKTFWARAKPPPPSHRTISSFQTRKPAPGNGLPNRIPSPKDVRAGAGNRCHWAASPLGGSVRPEQPEGASSTQGFRNETLLFPFLRFE